MQALKQAAREGDSARLDALCDVWSVSANCSGCKPMPLAAPQKTEPKQPERESMH